MAKKRLKQEDFLTFSGVGEAPRRRGDTPKQDRNLAEELYKKNWQAQTIDSFEKAMGIRPNNSAKPNLRYKSRVFSPDYEKDSALLNELMNHPKFSIIYWKDNWTVEGLYKAYVIYSENLDYVDPKEEIKNIAEGKE